MTSKFIDITPTWQGLLPALLAVIEHGNAQGRAMARAELSRMAEAADLYNEGLSAPPAHIPGDCADAKPESLTITHLHDEGHGWLGIDYSVIDRLKIGHRISPYSYRGTLAWLEEDRDAPTLLTALESAGIAYRIVNQHVEGDAFVRNLPRWSNN